MDNSFFDFLMPLITNFGSYVVWGLIFILLFAFGGEKGKKVAIVGLLALLFTNIIVLVLKYVIAEPRPFLTLHNVDLLVSENEIYSFPSGHTASSFAATVVMGLKYSLKINNKRYKLIYPLIVFALIIAFSRIYIGVHYPIDVVGGAITGALCALIALKFEDKIIYNKISRTLSLDRVLEFSITEKIKKYI